MSLQSQQSCTTRASSANCREPHSLWTALKVNGKFTATLSKGNKSTQEEVYVVDGLCMPLLGGLAAMKLQLVARLDNISLDTKGTVKRVS